MTIMQNDSAPAAERKPLSLREALLGSSIIPALGKTFAEASIDLKGMIARYNAIADDNGSDKELSASAKEWIPVEDAIMSGTPATLRDVIAILDRVVDELPSPMRDDEQDVKCLPRVLEALRDLHLLADHAARNVSHIIPSIGKTIAEAGKRWGHLKAMEDGGANLSNEQIAEMERLEVAVVSADPGTLHDAAAILDVVYTEGGGAPMDKRDAAAVRRVADFLRLIAATSETGAATASEREDSAILDAFAAWVRKEREFDTPLSDEEAERLSEEADELALDVIQMEPKTSAGFAIQYYLTLHLQHGGSTENPAAISMDPISGDGAVETAERTLLRRAMRIAAGTIDKVISDTSEFQPSDDAVKVLDLVTQMDIETQRGFIYFIKALRDITAGSTKIRKGMSLVPEIAAFYAKELRKELDRFADADDSDHAFMMAWESYMREASIFYSLPDSATDEEMERHARRLTAYRLPVEEIPVTTLKGINLKLRYTLLHLLGDNGIEKFLIFGHEPTKDFLDSFVGDYREAILWQLIQATGGTAMVPANTSDSFAATVTAFEAEAPATLSVPQQPTGGMVEAGAIAAGITPEQFQAAYAAAVEALKQERAA